MKRTFDLRINRVRALYSTTALALAVGLAVTSQPADAAAVRFDLDPFTGSTALTTPGRQVFAGLERTLASFDLANDVFQFNGSVFGFTGALSFINVLSSGIPGSGSNVIVLQDVDNDNNPATPFAAGTAASVIAGRVNSDGAGFFVYHNSVLDLNRLVFSTNLNDPTADLSVLARIASPTGRDAVNALPGFNAGNFATVPEPSSVALMFIGMSAVLLGSRRVKGLNSKLLPSIGSAAA